MKKGKDGDEPSITITTKGEGNNIFKKLKTILTKSFAIECPRLTKRKCSNFKKGQILSHFNT